MMSAALIADKLHASLLQAAIQGKLTMQLAEDGDARDLLNAIEAEKARLIEEEIIKKEKPLSPITDNEIPFEIPENWTWVKLGNILQLISGQDLTVRDYSDIDIGMPYITGASNFFNGSLTINRWTNNPRSIATEGDLLLTCKGTIGDMAFLLVEKAHIARQVMAISDKTQKLDLNFIKIVLDNHIKYLKSVAKSMIPGINRDDVLSCLIPLPPLAEQHRIVEAIETALAKIDKLKTDETKLDDIQKAFPNKLRASLLQSAIQGQLTEQLPEDGNACDLIKEIEAEKARLIEEKIIKKEKPLLPITEDEIPFEIPESWVWVRLGDLCSKVGAGSTPSGGKAVYLDNGIKFIRSQNVHNDGLYLDNIAFIAEKTHVSKKGSTVYPKDLLLNITGGSIGRCCIVPDDFDTANVNQHVLILRLFDEKIRFYLHQVIISPFIFKLIMDLQVGGTKEGLSATSAKNLLIPFPPPVEQERIVKKLDEILGKVDGLKKVAE